MLSKSLIQFSVGGRGRVPSQLFDLRPNHGGGKKIMASFKRSPPCTAVHSALDPAAGHHHPTASTGDSWTLTGKSGSVSSGVTPPFSWVLVHTRFYLCPPRVCSPVLSKFCNQIPLASKVKLSGHSQSLCQIPRVVN